MKKKICLILAIVFVMMLVQSIVYASEISLYNNNTLRTDTVFLISSDGVATVYTEYVGYSDITTGAEIAITIEKRNLLFFWSDVVSETITVNGYRYSNEFAYQLEDTGTYRCTVVYTVSGTGGADDVLTFEDTKTYG